MSQGFARFLLLSMIVLAIVPPGYASYLGAYAALVAALPALGLLSWREGSVWRHPTVIAIVAAIVLVTATVPFVFRSQTDLMGPVLILPMLATASMGLYGDNTRWIPSARQFAAISLAAVALALALGVIARFGFGIYRPGLGNNPIHYSTLAVIAGCMAVTGVLDPTDRRRYWYLAGPLMGICCAVITDSRGPMAAGVVTAAVAAVMLFVWFRKERGFRIAALSAIVVGGALTALLVLSGNERVGGILRSGLAVFHFTGTPDDIRAALYASALIALQQSPVVGLGFGQIMEPVRTFFPEQSEAFQLENLHADWANFAAMSGGMGLLAYVLLIVSPLLMLTSRAVRADRVTVLGVTLLSLSQLFLGVSNAMFGVIPQTVIFAVGTGYFVARSVWLRRQLSEANGQAPHIR